MFLPKCTQCHNPRAGNVPSVLRQVGVGLIFQVLSWSPSGVALFPELRDHHFPGVLGAPSRFYYTLLSGARKARASNRRRGECATVSVSCDGGLNRRKLRCLKHTVVLLPPEAQSPARSLGVAGSGQRVIFFLNNIQP